MSDPYTIPDGELCKVCGLTFYQRSFGGPNVCPSCDCGNFGAPVVQLQAKEIERLRAELEKMTESNAANWTNWWDVTQERDAALARERGLREALEAWHTFATGALHWDSTDWLVRITDAALAASVGDKSEPLSAQPPVIPKQDLWEWNFFDGDPPEGYSSWNEWCSSNVKRRAYIRARTGEEIQYQQELEASFQPSVAPNGGLTCPMCGRRSCNCGPGYVP